MPSEVVHFRVSREYKEYLLQLAAARGLDLSELMRRLIAQEVQPGEDVETAAAVELYCIKCQALRETTQWGFDWSIDRRLRAALYIRFICAQCGSEVRSLVEQKNPGVITPAPISGHLTEAAGVSWRYAVYLAADVADSVRAAAIDERDRALGALAMLGPVTNRQLGALFRLKEDTVRKIVARERRRAADEKAAAGGGENAPPQLPRTAPLPPTRNPAAERKQKRAANARSRAEQRIYG